MEFIGFGLDMVLRRIEVTSQPLYDWLVRTPRTATVRKYITLLARDGERCHLCNGRLGIAPDAFLKAYTNGTLALWKHARPTLDHLVPRSRRGASNLSNLKLAHSLCNSQRSDRPIVPHDVERVEAAGGWRDPLLRAQPSKPTERVTNAGRDWVPDNGR